MPLEFPIPVPDDVPDAAGAASNANVGGKGWEINRCCYQEFCGCLAEKNGSLGRLLNEGSERDSFNWLMRQQNANNQNLCAGVAVYPILKIGNRITIRVGYSFHTEEISVQFEDNESYNHYVRFSEKDWTDFMLVEPLILPLLRIFDGSSIFTTDDYLRIHAGKIQRDLVETEQKFWIKVNDRIQISVSRVVEDPRAGIVEFKCITQPGAEERMLGLPHKVSSNKLRLSSGRYDYFSRFLALQVSQGVAAWGDVRKKCGDMWGPIAHGRARYDMFPMMARGSYTYW